MGPHNKVRYFQSFTYIVEPHAADRFPGSCHVIRTG